MNSRQMPVLPLSCVPHRSRPKCRFLPPQLKERAVTAASGPAIDTPTLRVVVNARFRFVAKRGNGQKSIAFRRGSAWRRCLIRTVLLVHSLRRSLRSRCEIFYHGSTPTGPNTGAFRAEWTDVTSMCDWRGHIDVTGHLVRAVSRGPSARCSGVNAIGISLTRTVSTPSGINSAYRSNPAEA